MPTINKHFHKNKMAYDPDLIIRLSDTIHKQAEISNKHVSLLIHEEKRPYKDAIYKVLGVFKTNLAANQMALDFFKNKYEVFLEVERDADWPSPYELESATDPAEVNSIGWHLASSGELTLKATGGGYGELYSVYVKRQEVYESPQSKILEESDPEDDPMPELLPGTYASFSDSEYLYF